MSLKSIAITGGKWVALSTWARVALQFMQTIILARLLTPNDFGTLALAMGFFSVVSIFADLGLSNAIMHFDRPDHNTWSTLYWLNLLVGVGLMLLFIALAIPVANFYENPLLGQVLIWVGLVFPLNASVLQYKVLEEKELRFKSISFIDIVAAIFGVFVAISCAYAGLGIYALVAGLILSTLIRVILTLCFLAKGCWPAFCFRLKAVSKFLRYGFYRMGETLSNTIGGQADIFIGGYFSSAASLGLYSISRDLSLQIANAGVNPIVTRIGLPVMIKLRDDQSALRALYLQMLRMTSSINLPIYMFLTFFTEDIVHLIWGEQWSGAVPFLQILAVWGAIRSTGNPVGALLHATGSVRRAFLWNVGLLVLTALAVTLGSHLKEVFGLAVAMLSVQAFIFLPLWRFLVYPTCGASLWEYLAQLLPSCTAAIVTGIMCSLLLSSLDLGSAWIRLCIAGVVGAILYMCISFWVNRAWLNMLRDIIVSKSKTVSSL